MIIATRIRVAEDNALHRHTVRRTEVEHLVAVAEPGRHVHLHREMRFSLCDARAGERLALARGELTADANLTNDSRFDAGAASPFCNVANQLAGNVVFTLGVVLFRL